MAAVVQQDTLALFGQGVIEADGEFASIRRVELGPRSWIDHQPLWLGGSETLLGELLDCVEWQQYRRPMYERLVDEPRLTAYYPAGAPWPHARLSELAEMLSRRYGQPLHHLGLNLYRHGADSVAWHGDRVGRVWPEPVVAIVSLGAPRPFLVRPKGGGASRAFRLGWGDLLVMGGRCQQEFDHAVPKVAAATPRLSVMFRPVGEQAGDWFGAGRAVVPERSAGGAR